MNGYFALIAFCGLLATSSARAGLPGQPDSAATLPNLAITIDVMANDGLSGTIVSKVATHPAHGTARWVGNQILYTPATGFHGTDSFRYSVIARSGRAANQLVTISVDAANGSTITLVGRAKAGVPLANATVTADVGSLHYSTQTDSQGKYTLAISGLSGSMVALRAQGSGAQSKILLESTLDEMSLLSAEAGDGILTRDEDNQVQITELSTALAYTLEYANGGVRVADDMELELASKSIDLDQTSSAVFAIRSIGVGECALPDGFANTDELIRNPQALHDFILYINFEVVNRTKIESMQDPDVVLPSAPSDFVGNFNLISEYGMPGTISERLQGVKISNAAAGTGRYTAGLMQDDTTTWTADGTGIRIVHNNPYSYETYTYIPTGYARTLVTYDAFNVIRVARLGGRLIDGIVQHSKSTYPDNPEIPELDAEVPSLLFSQQGGLPYTSTELTSAGRLFPTQMATPSAPFLSYGAQFFVFSPNHTGHASGRFSSSDFIWSIDAAGSIVVTYPNGTSTTYAKLDEDGSLGEGVMAEFRTTDGVFASYGIAAIASGNGPFTAGELAKSWESGVGLASTSIFKYVDAYYMKLDDPGQTGAKLQVEQGQVFATPLSWTVDDGTMYATEYYDGHHYVSYCEIGVGGCVAWLAYRWTPVARDGNRIYVLEDRYYDDDENGYIDDNEIYVQGVMFYEIGSPYTALKGLNPAEPPTLGTAPDR